MMPVLYSGQQITMMRIHKKFSSMHFIYTLIFSENKWHFSEKTWRNLKTGYKNFQIWGNMICAIEKDSI